jgi:tetratricopeptide (TPR) repeat protein
MQTLKLFVSSPGDVMVERRRVENVASRLNGEFAGVARLEVIRWETKNYQAFSTFQAQIPRSVDCDLVIGILKWRLGTELPPDFSEKLPDGHSFPSGTAYEILTAIEKRQKGLELPDVYVFRFAGSSPAVAIEDPDRARIERDWQLLKGFMQEWFLTAQGHFKAAFNPYTSEDDFETQLEQLLRGWLAEKVAGGRAVRWPIEVKGSPFCGLAAFGARHAPVFFGRTHDTARAVDLWREAGQRQSPYLLVIGASGSGKSSLARAGAVPRLTTPGVIRDVDVWRVAVMRPSDSPQGPFAALAAALMQSEAGLSKEEEGRGAALPEIALGDSRTLAAFTSVLRHADSSAIAPIVNALDYVAGAEHDRGNYTRDVRCDLVLLIDQLDELFAASVNDAERDGFLDLVAAMVATGRIWVVTTLRADLYPRLLGQPALKKLKELGATFDLAPPGPVELAEIVRNPAEAAGLVYETDAASGERLDARLLRDAEQPDMLPLVQLALSRLFEGRQQVGGELRLPFAVYESLGGLKGIVDEAGERAITSVGEQEQARLPRLLRQLAVPALNQGVAASDALTIRAVPLTQAAPDAATRTLLDALVTARLLTVSGNETEGKDKSIAPAEAQVRLAHQRVLEDWGRARTIVAESADFYRVRSDLEENYRRWNSGGRRGELLLARGLPLAEADNLVGKYGDELTPEVKAYVKASRKRANRTQIVGWSAAAVFALMTVAASIFGALAYQAQLTADSERIIAENALKQVDIKRQLAEMRLAAADELLDGNSIEKLRQCMASTERSALQPPPLASREFFVGRWHVDQETSSTDVDWRADGTCVTNAIFAETTHRLDLKANICTWRFQRQSDKTFVIEYQSSKLGDLFPKKLPFTIVSPTRIHNTALNYDAFRIICPEQELDGYQKLLIERQKLVDADGSNSDHQRNLSNILETIADALSKQEKYGDALDSYVKSIAIRNKLASSEPSNQGWQRELAVSYERIGQVHLNLGHTEPALDVYRASLDIRQKLNASNPGIFQFQHDLAESYAMIGIALITARDKNDSRDAFKRSIALRESLAKANRGNTQLQRELVISLTWLSRVSNAPDAKAALTKALMILEGLEPEQKLTSDMPFWPDFVRGELAKLP